jgi:ABC-type antimicrobial peptide transport system permease subunit
MGFFTRLVFLGIIGFLVGLLLGAVNSGRLVVPVSADTVTVIVGIAEVIVAVTLMFSVAIEGSTFLWKGEQNTMST